MNSQTLKILNELEQGITLTDLLKLGSTKQELMENINTIRLNGYQIDYITSNDKLFLKTTTNKTSPYKEVLSFNITKRRFSSIVISDTHIRDHHDFTYYGIMRKYAKSKGATTIIHVGDILDQHIKEKATSIRQKDRWEKELKYMVTNHPYFKDTSIIYIKGNHDERMLATHGIDITDTIIRNRLDFVPLGVGSGIIKINDKVIALDHPSKFDRNDIYNQNLLNKYKDYDIDIILRGHIHEQKSYYYNNTLVLQTAPFLKKMDTLPTFYVLDFNINDAKVESLKATSHLIIGEKVYKTNENIYDFKEKVPVDINIPKQKILTR